MPDIEFKPADHEACSALLSEYRETLMAPMDDMWAAFADMAQPFLLTYCEESVGFFNVNEERELNRFYVREAFSDQAAPWFRQVISRQDIQAALPATLDPAFLSLSLDLAQDIEVKALVFHHAVAPQPVNAPLTSMRTAEEGDLEAAIAFEQAAIGAPLEFLQHYVAARIATKELLLHEVEGAIDGIGELRPDAACPGYAHLGMIVGESQRGRGLGRAIFTYLIEEARRRELKPLCSTEPTNLAARRALERAGFRAHHRVLRVGFDSKRDDG